MSSLIAVHREVIPCLEVIDDESCLGHEQKAAEAQTKERQESGHHHISVCCMHFSVDFIRPSFVSSSQSCSHDQDPMRKYRVSFIIILSRLAGRRDQAKTKIRCHIFFDKNQNMS